MRFEHGKALSFRPELNSTVEMRADFTSLLKLDFLQSIRRSQTSLADRTSKLPVQGSLPFRCQLPKKVATQILSLQPHISQLHLKTSAASLVYWIQDIVSLKKSV